MAFARAMDGTRLYWRLDGAEDRPVLVLLNSIGTDIGLYDRAAPMLMERFRLLRVDTRGHGASDAPCGDYDLAQLAADVLTVVEAAEVMPAIVCGTSLGGMIAMEMALSAPDRAPALVLTCASAQMDRAAWRTRVDLVRSQGMGAIADMALERFFSERFRQIDPAAVGTVRNGLLLTRPDGYAGCAAAIRDMRLLPRLSRITAPCLMICGTLDVSTPFVGHGDLIVEALADARSVFLETGHLPSLEDPEGFSHAIANFAATLAGLRWFRWERSSPRSMRRPSEFHSGSDDAGMAGCRRGARARKYRISALPTSGPWLLARAGDA